MSGVRGLAELGLERVFVVCEQECVDLVSPTQNLLFPLVSAWTV